MGETKYEIKSAKLINALTGEVLVELDPEKFVPLSQISYDSTTDNKEE
jgi:hypothetical protein